MEVFVFAYWLYSLFQGRQQNTRGSPISLPYRIIDSDLNITVKVRDNLTDLAKVFWSRRDLKWAFPYVYALVTHSVIHQFNASRFIFGQQVLRLVGNFYELYALNLQQWLTNNNAEDPWKIAFRSPDYMRPYDPWGARSMAVLLLSMYAHIRSDLPRALAYVFLKFYANGNNPMAGRQYVFDDFKDDFNIMNKTVFPKVMDEIAKGNSQIIPSITTLIPSEWRYTLFNKRVDLEKEREDAWQTGKIYSSHPAVQQLVFGLSIANSVTMVKP